MLSGGRVPLLLATVALGACSDYRHNRLLTALRSSWLRPVAVALAQPTPPATRHAPPAPVAAPAPSPAVAAAPPAPPAPSASPAPAPPPAIQGVVLITIDALRADQPWTGYARPVAPELTALAQRAVVYTHMYSLASSTSMSLGAMLAGQYPSEVRRDGQLFNHYPREQEFFPERLQAAGVHTGAGHAHFYFAADYAGFNQGFERYEVLDHLHPDFTTVLDVTSDRQDPFARRIISSVAGDGTGRFFAWFHFMDPHDRYHSHRGIPSWGRDARAPYDGEVTFTDRHVGALVRWIESQPFGPHTAVVITADHGEAFGEHNDWHHGYEVWQPLVRVPFLVLLPGAAHRVIDNNRSHLDLAPTIASLLGVEPNSAWRGTSLVDEWRGGPTPERDVVVEVPETHVSAARRSFYTGNYEVLEWDDGRRTDVFDLSRDPGEEHPLPAALAAPYRQRWREFRATYREYVPPMVRARRQRLHERGGN